MNEVTCMEDIIWAKDEFAKIMDYKNSAQRHEICEEMIATDNQTPSDESKTAF